MGRFANTHERKVYDEGFNVAHIDAMVVVDPSAKPTSSKSRIERRNDLTDYSESNPFKDYVKVRKEYVQQYGCSAVGGCCGCGSQGIDALHKEFVSSPAENFADPVHEELSSNPQVSS